MQKISCISFVIQSEAKNLVNIKDDVYVNVSEILHFTSFRSEWQHKVMQVIFYISLDRIFTEKIKSEGSDFNAAPFAFLLDFDFLFHVYLFSLGISKLVLKEG